MLCVYNFYQFNSGVAKSTNDELKYLRDKHKSKLYKRFSLSHPGLFQKQILFTALTPLTVQGRRLVAEHNVVTELRCCGSLDKCNILGG